MDGISFPSWMKLNEWNGWNIISILDEIRMNGMNGNPGYRIERMERMGTHILGMELMHIAVLRTGRFGMYDYGWFRNLVRYGDFFAPQYEIAAIPAGMRFLLAHGGQDALSDDADFRHLLQVLPAAETLFVPHFAHGDFVLGSSAKTLVYDQLLLFFGSRP
jgi:hypothetical protein